jgi:hypothetical protein
MWTYSDYITYTDDSAKLTRLRLHIQEVSDAIGRELSGDGKSKSENNITQYLKDLRAEEKELAGVPGVGNGYNGGVSLSRARRAR